MTWRGLEIFGWHPTNPQLLSRLVTEGGAYGIDISGEYAYIADNYRGLSIVDISDPTSPQEINCYDTEGHAYDVVIDRGFAYLADWHNGFLVLDVSDPLAPFLTGHCPDIGKAYSIFHKDSLAYVGVWDSSLKIVNVADPSNPSVISEFPYGPGPYTYGLDAYVEDTLAYIGCHFQYGGEIINLAILNVANPANPIYLSGLSAEDISAKNRGIEKVGDYVYLNGQQFGVYIVDVADPSAPFVKARYDDDQGFGYGLIVYSNMLIIPHFLSGFSIVEITDFQKPVRLYHHRNIWWRHFVYDDSLSYLYVTGSIWENNQFYHSMLRLVDFRDPLNPVITGGLNFTGKDYLYIGSIDFPYLAMTLGRGNPPNESLYTAIVDVSDSYGPELYRFVEGGGVLDLQAPYLYCLFGAQILIADVNHPSFWVDTLNLPADAYDIVVSDTLAYLTVEDSLLILNVLTGRELGSCYHGYPYAIHISLDHPYLALPYTPFPGSTYGFLLFDVGDPNSPSLLFDTLVYEEPIDPQVLAPVSCELKDTLLYFCRDGYGLDIWNLNQLDSIYRIVTQDTPSFAKRVHVHNDIVIVSDYYGLELYRIFSQGIEEDEFPDEKVSMSSLEILPNPFKSGTRIVFNASAVRGSPGKIKLNVYDVSGRFVRGLLLFMDDTKKSATVSWDGTDDHGNKLPQGVYFIELETGRSVYTEKVVFLK